MERKRISSYVFGSGLKEYKDEEMRIFNGMILTQKGSNERLFLLTRTHSMQIVGEIPFMKPQNDT